MKVYCVKYEEEKENGIHIKKREETKRQRERKGLTLRTKNGKREEQIETLGRVRGERE